MLDKSSIRIDIFAHSLRSILEDNLTEYLLSTVSNMLAIYYAADKNLQHTHPNAITYAELCTKRLKDFLQEKVILDETFDIAMQTFAIAITPDMPKTEDLPNMNKLRDQEQVSEVIIAASLGTDIPEHEIKLLSDVLDIALDMDDANDIVSLMGAQPDVIKAILRGKKRSAMDIAIELSKAAKNTSKTNAIMSEFAQLAGLVTCSALAFAGNIVAVQSFEAIAAAVIIPVSVVALRYGAGLGEKIGAKLAEFDGSFKAMKAELTNMLPNLTPLTEIGPKIQVHEVKIHKVNVQDIAKDLSAHMDTISTEKEVEKIQKSLQAIKHNANELELNRSTHAKGNAKSL